MTVASKAVFSLYWIIFGAIVIENLTFDTV